jgi:methylenetetrahydrofolate--tRNA-(uracil-5-)-methyltransferase
MAPLNFFDAAAPIVTRDSLDMTKIFLASRYGRGGGDYLNCPMTEAEYDAFYDALASAELHDIHGFEKGLLFEGCLPVEELASRGRQTLAYGPLKPVGLIDPRTGRRPFAAVQLRQENLHATLYNIVGFQTRLKRGEQKRVFGLIPGLGRAEFARYGAMHLNTYIKSPDVLDANYALRGSPLVYFAGQITGVEGYVESAGSGLLAGLTLAAELRGCAPPVFTGHTMLGALMRHTITPTANYQPMNANFGLLDPLDERIKGRRARYERLAERALDEIRGTFSSV